MKKITKVMTALMICVSMLGGMISTASAASSDTWTIHYIPRVPSNISNQSDTLYVAYYSDGYIAECTSISGTNGRKLTISSEDAGGIVTNNGGYSDVSITTTGCSVAWEMRLPINDDVQFKVLADGRYSCDSKGIIRINN